MSFTSKLKSLLRHRSSLGLLAGLVLLLSALALRGVGINLSYYVPLVHGMMFIGGFALILASALHPVLVESLSYADQREGDK